MSSRVGGSSWSVELPPDWRVTDHPECLTLEQSDEGALQLSSAKKSNGVVLLEEVIDYAASMNEGWGSYGSVACGEFSGLFFQYVDGDRKWGRWFLMYQSTLLFVTYNGTPIAYSREHAAVVKILETLCAEISA